MIFNHSIIKSFLFFILMNFILNKLPSGFVYINDVDKSIIVNLKYYTKDNFIGERVPHYKANKGILTKKAAIALSKAQEKFLSKGYSIVVYDSYRPASSVRYFVDWMNDPNDTKRKKYHYPYVENKIDMKDEYISSKSGHSKGSTVDMTIIDVNKQLLKESVYHEREFNGKKYPFNDDNTIDCGTSYDLMDPASWSFNNYFDFTEEQKNNRELIRSVMESVGFKVLDSEWWHFTLENEPFPDEYYDFDIE